MKNKGFNYPELILVISIVMTMLGLVIFNLMVAQRNATLTTTIDTLVSDLKETQIKAFVSDTEGRVNPDNYGIYLEQNRYTIFHGSSYSALDPTNIVVGLDSSISITNITFPSSTILFLKRSGEVSGFIQGSNTFTLSNTSGTQQKTITINRYGAVTGIQ